MVWLSAPLVFFGGFYVARIGVGAQESIMRAAIADRVPAERRGGAYGLFNAGFGIAWFCGSFLMGFLYDRSIIALVVFSALAQIMAVPLFLRVRGAIEIVSTPKKRQHPKRESYALYFVIRHSESFAVGHLVAAHALFSGSTGNLLAFAQS